MTTTKRLATPALKNLPTLDESGMKGFNVSIWHGLYAPKGTPKAVLDQINTALRAALKDPEFIKREEALGAVIVTDGRLAPVEHKKFVESRSTVGTGDQGCRPVRRLIRRRNHRALARKRSPARGPFFVDVTPGASESSPARR